MNGDAILKRIDDATKTALAMVQMLDEELQRSASDLIDAGFTVEDVGRTLDKTVIRMTDEVERLQRRHASSASVSAKTPKPSGRPAHAKRRGPRRNVAWVTVMHGDKARSEANEVFFGAEGFESLAAGIRSGVVPDETIMLAAAKRDGEVTEAHVLMAAPKLASLLDVMEDPSDEGVRLVLPAVHCFKAKAWAEAAKEAERLAAQKAAA